MKNLVLILVLLIGLSSCDSREDWFKENSEGPDLIVTVNGVTDTILKGESRCVTIDLHSIKLDDACLYTDTVNLNITGGDGIPMSRAYFNGMPLQHMRDYCKTNGDTVTVSISHYYGVTEDVSYFESDTTAKLLETNKTEMWVVDAFDNREYYNIIINIYGPIPPTPVLKVEKLKDNYEYVLSLEDSYDRDGKVQKYEWCIDGNIVSYSDTDNRFEYKRKGNWKAGQAAYGGKYITATALSSINHSFQTTGEHTVYYRCMDDMGIWSMWYSQKINVEE